MQYTINDSGSITFNQTRIYVDTALNVKQFQASIGGSWITLATAGSGYNPGWGDITGKPTTVSGYGITDAYISSRTIILNGGTMTVPEAINTLPASSVTITDSGSYFTGETVEAALQELGATIRTINTTLDNINGEVL